MTWPLLSNGLSEVGYPSIMPATLPLSAIGATPTVAGTANGAL
jgi:hypothetical protein